MIGSIFEQRDQLGELEKRRQDIASQQSMPRVGTPATAPIAAGMQAAGYATAPMAVKATEPDIGKRRKDRCRKGHDLAQDDATTGSADEGRGYRDAMDDEASRKSFRDRGITEGPGDSPEPGRVAAEEFDRPYLSAGHSSEAPAAEPPRQSPIFHAPQGIVQAIQLPDAPVVGYVPSHVTARVSMGSPSERAR